MTREEEFEAALQQRAQQAIGGAPNEFDVLARKAATEGGGAFWRLVRETRPYLSKTERRAFGVLTLERLGMRA